MTRYHFSNPQGARKRPTYYRPIVQFSIRSLFMFTLTVVAVVSICRHEPVSAILGLTILFAMLVFAKDIWPKLPG